MAKKWQNERKQVMSKETLVIKFNSKKERLIVRGEISPYNEVKLLIDIIYATIKNQGYTKEQVKELIDKQNEKSFNERAQWTSMFLE